MADQIVLYEARYPAAMITLNNPDHRNALSATIIDGPAGRDCARRGRSQRSCPCFNRLAVPRFPQASTSANCARCWIGCASTKRDAYQDGALRGEALIERVYRLGKPYHRRRQRRRGRQRQALQTRATSPSPPDGARIGYTEMKQGIQRLLNPPPDAIIGDASRDICC